MILFFQEMEKRNRGQTIFGLSFGVIFSIILIIFLIGVAVYVIVYFLNIGSCSEIGIFYENLQDEIDKAWSQGIYQGTLSQLNLPSEIEFICFGNLSLTRVESNSVSLRNQILSEYIFTEKSNIFFYPAEESCDGDLASNSLEHVTFNEFFCTEVADGKINARLSKENGAALVSISKA